jgi:uncharacterized protein (TIGR02145 family)
MDRNLGAQQAATAFDDYKAYGDLFQWGRPADGHQLINWTSKTTGTPVNGITNVLATTDIPGHGNFILCDLAANPFTGDWRSDNNRGRWATNPQGPCPAGWHIPTLTEWQAEVSNTIGIGSSTPGTATTGGMTMRSTAFDLLKLTVPSYRVCTDGSLFVGSESGIGAGSWGSYWSSSDRKRDGVPHSEPYSVSFGRDYAQIVTSQHTDGISVRCIKNL